MFADVLRGYRNVTLVLCGLYYSLYKCLLKYEWFSANSLSLDAFATGCKLVKSLSVIQLYLPVNLRNNVLPFSF